MSSKTTILKSKSLKKKIMNKKLRNALILFVILMGIITIKTNTEMIKFYTLVFTIAGTLWLVVDRVFKKKGCEVCHNTIAEFKDKDGKNVCKSCYNKKQSEWIAPFWRYFFWIKISLQKQKISLYWG